MRRVLSCSRASHAVMTHLSRVSLVSHAFSWPTRSRASSTLCLTGSHALRALCPTCSLPPLPRVLRAFASHVPRALRAPVPYLFCTLCVLLLRVLSWLTCLVPYGLSSLMCLVPYVLSCTMCFVPYVLSRVLCALVPHVTCALRVLLLLHSRALGAFVLLIVRLFQVFQA